MKMFQNTVQFVATMEHSWYLQETRKKIIFERSINVYMRILITTSNKICTRCQNGCTVDGSLGWGHLGGSSQFETFDGLDLNFR